MVVGLRARDFGNADFEFCFIEGDGCEGRFNFFGEFRGSPRASVVQFGGDLDVFIPRFFCTSASFFLVKFGVLDRVEAGLGVF